MAQRDKEEDYSWYLQVDLDDGRASKMTDQAGGINKEDFIQFAKDTHLLDFDSAMGEAMLLLSPRKTRKQPQTPKKGQHRNMEETVNEKVMREFSFYNGILFLTKKFTALS